jgi:hypothetical protein
MGAATMQQRMAEVVAMIAVVASGSRKSIGKQRDEILQGQVVGLVGDAVDRKPRHRQHDQRNHERREQPENRLGPVDF